MGQPLVAKELRTILESLVKALGTAIAVGKTAIKAPCPVMSEYLPVVMGNSLSSCHF